MQEIHSSYQKAFEATLDGQLLKVKGPKGEVSRVNHKLVKVEMLEAGLQFSPATSSKESNALTGTSCALAKKYVARCFGWI